MVIIMDSTQELKSMRKASHVTSPVATGNISLLQTDMCYPNILNIW